MNSEGFISKDMLEKDVFYVDSAEKNTITWPVRDAAIKYFTDLGYEVKVGSLFIGDYIFNNMVFERKLITDYVSSIQSEHLFDQAVRMKQNFSYCFILIEGSQYDFIYDENNYGKRRFSEKHFNGSFASLEMSYDVRVLPPQETYFEIFDLIHRLIKKSDPNKKIDINHLFTKKRDIYAEDVLMCTKGVAKSKAQLLLSNFTIDEIRNASIEELCEIKGIGPKYAEKLKNDLNKMATFKFEESMI